MRPGGGDVPAGLDRNLSAVEDSGGAQAEVATSKQCRNEAHWRPQLQDPNDEMVLETAINGHADAIVTFNRIDFVRAAKGFSLRVLSASETLERVVIL
ncbi:MAG: PIN domain-containing protein [Terracidiphilus sp.]